jgi:type I restriction enzyme S subunit
MKIVIAYYKDLTRWDVKSFLIPENIGAEHVRLGNFLRKKQVSWDCTNDVPMLSLHFGGLFSQRESNNIKGKLFVAEKGDLVYSKIDLRNGAIGVIPENFSRAVFTTEFPVYEIDASMINPSYLQLYLQSEIFKKLINSIVSGASGRKRVKPDDFENLFVYAPAFSVQEKIVERWQKAQKEARELKTKASEKEKAIDEFLMQELGIEKTEHKKRSGAFVVRFKDLDRWDVQFFAGGINLIAKNFVPLKNAIRQFENRKTIPRNGIAYHYVGLENVEKNTGKYETINCDGEKIKSQSLVLKKNCLYYAKLRPYLNKAFLFEGDEEYSIATGELYGFSVKDGVDTKFILRILLSELVQNQIKDLMIGARMPRISEESFENLKIVLPSLKIQKEIVAKIERMREEVQKLRHESTEILKTAKNNVQSAIVGKNY